MQNQKPVLPELPLESWEQSKMTLHLYLQIVGKIRMALMPRKNHWWNLTLYVSPKGLTTYGIPLENGLEKFELTFNFLKHQLEIITSRGQTEYIPLQHGLSVSEFYQTLFGALNKLEIPATIFSKPYDLPVKKPFYEIREYAHYQAEYIERFWRILMWIDSVFKEFSGRFSGKTSPVHLYWHHTDLAVTRFSGRSGPELSPDSSISEKDAYSHEVISFGFWAGDEAVREPAFYSYTYPAPAGLDKKPILPSAASWVDNNGSPTAMLMYNDLRREKDPRNSLLDFLESTYTAGAKLANWDIEGLKVPSLDEL